MFHALEGRRMGLEVRLCSVLWVRDCHDRGATVCDALGERLAGLDCIRYTGREVGGSGSATVFCSWIVLVCCFVLPRCWLYLLIKKILILLDISLLQADL